MSLYSITKYIFSNKEYNTIKNWYDKTCKAANPDIWKEYIKRVNPTGDANSFEYKESLYRKKNVLTKLQTIYIKSSEICSLYPKAVEIWMKENGIYSLPLSFIERETIIKKESEINTIYSYLNLADKNKTGLDSYLNDHQKININTIDGRKLILEETEQIEHRTKVFKQLDNIKAKYPYGFESFQEEFSLINLKEFQNALQITKSEYEIKKRNEVIIEFYEIKEKYIDGLASYLQENNSIRTNTFNGKKSVVNDKAVIQYKNSIVKEYNKLNDKYREEVECYIKHHGNININSYEGIAQIVSSKGQIISIRETFTKYIEIKRLYPDAFNIFLQENSNVNEETLDGKRYIVSNESEIQSINTTMDNFRSLDVRKNMLSGYVCFFNLTFVPKTFPFTFQKQAYENRKELRKLQNSIQTIKSFKFLYPKVYPFLLQAFEDPALKEHFKDNPVLRLKRSEIEKISQMHLDLQITEDFITKSKELGNKSITTEIVMDFSDNGLEKKRRYLRTGKMNSEIQVNSSPKSTSNTKKGNGAAKESESKTQIIELEEFQRYIRKIRTYKSKYPQAYPYLLQAFEDVDLVEHFKDDPVLRLNRSEIKRIAMMKDELQVTEDFISISKLYKKRAIEYITNSVDILDFTKEGINKKCQLIIYDRKFSKLKPNSTVNLQCDIEDKNTKVRCILNSEVYGDGVKFVDTFTIIDFYNLASRIKGYGKTFDEIERFRKENSKAIKSYNERYNGKYAYFVNDFDLIGSNNKDLISWLQSENEREKILKIAKEKVNKIKAKYPNGYNVFIRKTGYQEATLSIEQLNTIADNEHTIYEFEIIENASKLITECPNGAVEVFGFVANNKLNSSVAQKIVDSASLIRTKQTEYNNRKRIEEEQNQKINEAKNIASLYPDGFKKYFSDTTVYNIDYRKAINIISYKSEIIDRHTTIRRIKSAVSSWGDVKGIPYYYFYHYYPTRFTDITSSSREARKLIYDFKNGTSHYNVLTIIKQKLRNTFTDRDLSNFCFVCIPASTIQENICRYRDFSKELCNSLDMYNGFEHITITKEKEKSHLGGTDKAEYNIDGNYFNGKYIILFDDVVTRGRSMQEFKQLLENRGATIICALSIGRTYSDYYGEHREPHPWTNEY